MATRQQKMQFAVKRLKGFLNTFRKSKRGLVGLLIIIVFSIVGIFCPFIAPYDPLYPQYGEGLYPALGKEGVPIAYRLSVPVWYKYLPFIQRGPVEITENFENIVKTYVFGASMVTLQTFGSEGSNNLTDDGLLLSRRVASIENVEANPNGTSVTLDSSQWHLNASAPRLVRIVDIYPNGTIFKVTYRTGTDLGDNIKVVKDHTFSAPESFDVWSWATNDTSGAISVDYNSQKGFTFNPDKPSERGCLQVSYTPEQFSQDGFIEVTILADFTYQYDQPPQEFEAFTSIMVEGTTNYVPVSMLFYNTNLSKTFVLSRFTYVANASQTTQLANATYSHFRAPSYMPVVKDTVGIDPPQDGIFPSQGEYKFGVQILIPRNVAQNISVYLDNVDCWLYGNTFGLLGTDNSRPLPRDLFSTLVWGTRVSLIVGVLSAIFSTVIGLFLGLISGYIGGIVDEGIMRFADLLLVLPTLPLFIVLISALQRVSGYVSIWNIIIILTLLGWMGFARSVRSMVLSIRERAFIEAAKAAGAGKLHIVNRHIIPNVFSLVYITLATAVPGAIITEASLSWLGLGDPMLPSWGKVLYDFNTSGIQTTKGLTEFWFWLFPACIAIALLATAFILVGYALDEILNPRLRERR